jgi:hypothetical protein
VSFAKGHMTVNKQFSEGYTKLQNGDEARIVPTSPTAPATPHLLSSESFEPQRRSGHRGSRFLREGLGHTYFCSASSASLWFQQSSADDLSLKACHR